MSAPVVQIEKLDENNYDSWSIQMRSVLIHSSFWKIVNGQTPKAEEAVAKPNGNQMTRRHWRPFS